MFLAFDVDALVAAGEMTVASGKLTLSVEDLLANVIEGYLFRDLLSLVEEVKPKPVGACCYPIMMSILAGTELLGGIVSPAGQGNRIETYWKRYMASVNNRFNYVAEIASDLTRNGIGHSYLTHFGVLVVRGAPSLHSTRPSNDWFTFDCLELDRDFRRSYELAIADILADREEAQKRVSRLVEHDLEKARRQLQALPIGLFPITPPTQAQLATLHIPGI